MLKKMMLWVCLAVLAMGMPAAHAQQPCSVSWYEIFVRSYQDSNGDGVGDLQGVISRLDYIQELGFDGIWLMPVMPSPSYHKYDVTDYMDVDPEYGTLEDFKQLAEECRKRQIRVIVDLPINHSSVQHPWFAQAAEALRRGEAADSYAEYYCFAQSGGPKHMQLAGTDWYYEEQFSGGGMPDLNLDSAAVRAELTAIMDFWLNECGADGFRLDAVTSYYAGDTQKNVNFLRWLKNTAESLKPGCFLVGEAWTGLNTIAEYCESGIDSFFLFPAAQAEGYIARTIRARSKPAQQFIGFMQQVEDALGDHLRAPFLGNHDTGRAVGSLQARSVPERAKFAHALASLMGGAAFTYYGDEIGMTGSGEDPNKRLAMYWNDDDLTSQPPGATQTEYAFPCADEQLEDENSLLAYIRNLNRLKKQVPAIALGQNEFVYSDDDLCVMKRTWNGEACWIAVNFSGKTAHEYSLAEPGLTLAGQLDAFEKTAQVVVQQESAFLTLPPYAIAVFVK